MSSNREVFLSYTDILPTFEVLTVNVNASPGWCRRGGGTILREKFQGDTKKLTIKY